MASNDEEEISGSDADDGFREDMEALRRACLLTGTNPTNLESSPSPTATANSRGGTAATTSPSDSEADNAEDDLEIVRNIQKKFAGLVDINEPLALKPLCSLPPIGAEDNAEDDFETLRAIQRRFSAYDEDCQRESMETVRHNLEQVGVTNIASEKETSNNLFVEPSNSWEGFRNCVDKSSSCTQNVEAGSDIVGSRPSDFIEWHKSGADETAILPVKSSGFPKSAQAFVDAIKKNRSCQKLIRSKLMHIEARIEEIRKLKDRVKILKDFQVSCRKRTGRALSQKKDARAQLITVPKLRAKSKLNEKKSSALYYGPVENSQVAHYRDALKKFPVFLGQDKWSEEEQENLAKGVKQQFQEMLLQRSLDLVSDADGFLGYSGNLDSIVESISALDITPENMRLFLPKVNWDQLASMYVPGRSGVECQSRWLNCEDPLINHSPWSTSEDKNLLHVVQQKGLSNWIDIAVSLGTNRTPFQCLLRYQRSLNASIIKREWTDKEDNQLRAAVEAFGESNWQVVASAMEGRTGTQCSNRWYKTLHPARQKVGRWTSDEDKRLKVAVLLFGPKTWKKIAQFVSGRTQVQCRERWVNCLDPSLNLSQWTEEEDLRLKAAIAEHGYCWSKVATCVPPRTDNQCRRRWKVLLPQEVPLLRAARNLQRAALISNFVDRESERPALGPNDFVPLSTITFTSETENANPTGKRKRRSSDLHSEEVPLLTNGSEIDNSISNSIRRKKRQKRPSRKTSPTVDFVAITNGEELEPSGGISICENRNDLNGENKMSRGRPESTDILSCNAAISKRRRRNPRHLSSLVEAELFMAPNEVFENLDGDARRKRKRKHKTQPRSIDAYDASVMDSELHNGSAGLADQYQNCSSPIRCSTPDILESGNYKALGFREHNKPRRSKAREFLNKMLDEEENDMTLASFLQQTGKAKKTMASSVKVDKLHKKGFEVQRHWRRT